MSVPNPGLNQPAYSDLNLTLARLGGNRWTAYNWKTNASNAGNDYRFSNDNYLDKSTSPGDAVMGLSTKANGGVAAILTVPINGYVSADEAGPVPPHAPPELSPRFVPEFPSASDDPHPAANHVYQDDFLKLLQNAFAGRFQADREAPVFLMLDNEPDLWPNTHPEVHPARPTYSELIERSVAYAKMIKRVKPGALVFGPASYGWNGFMSFQDAPDARDNNAAINPATSQTYGDFLAYYLAKMNEAGKSAGIRLLDALDVHWYPEAMGPNATGTMTRIDKDNKSPGVTSARMNAPRSLWDSTYVEESWITKSSTRGKPIALLPRLLAEIRKNYPDTRLSISEYNFGGGTDISGGIAEADVLGLMGRYNVFAAAEWPLSRNERFVFGALRMFRNYDGNKSTFGDLSISAENSDPADTSIYASLDSSASGLLRLVLINRTTAPMIARVNVGKELAHPVFSAHQLTSQSAVTPDGSSCLPADLGQLPNTQLNAFTMPPQSVSMLTMFLKQ
jgi:hypothetical protein